jgi:hypothetical protein
MSYKRYYGGATVRLVRGHGVGKGCGNSVEVGNRENEEPKALPCRVLLLREGEGMSDLLVSSNSDGNA